TIALNLRVCLRGSPRARHPTRWPPDGTAPASTESRRGQNATRRPDIPEAGDPCPRRRRAAVLRYGIVRDIDVRIEPFLQILDEQRITRLQAFQRLRQRAIVLRARIRIETVGCHEALPEG